MRLQRFAAKTQIIWDCPQFLHKEAKKGPDPSSSLLRNEFFCLSSEEPPKMALQRKIGRQKEIGDCPQFIIREEI